MKLYPHFVSHHILTDMQGNDVETFDAHGHCGSLQCWVFLFLHGLDKAGSSRVLVDALFDAQSPSQPSASLLSNAIELQCKETGSEGQNVPRCAISNRAHAIAARPSAT